MKRSIFAIIFIVPFFVMGQDTLQKSWEWTGITGLNLNQASFSNWTAGGVNSIAFSALGKFSANHKKDKFSWNNNLNLMYGVFKNQDESMKKNEDLIELISVLGVDLTKKWSFVGYVGFRTQFANGYDKDNDTNRISAFMSPAYLTLSPAFRYQPVDWFYLLLSPATAKFTFVLDQELADGGAFGVQGAELDENGSIIEPGTGENWLLYLGPFMEAYMKKEIAKNLTFESRFNVLYTFLNRDNLEAYDMDMSWENFLNYKIAKYFTASLFLHFLYYPGQPVISFDNYEGAVRIKATPNRHIQIKETFGFGITYSFPNN